jgi:hypothetical protein
MSTMEIVLIPLGITALTSTSAFLRWRWNARRDPLRPAPAPRPAALTWRVSRKAGMVYRLINLGPQPATDVCVSATEESIVVKQRGGPWEEVPPGKAGEFVVTTPAADVSVVLRVSWTNNEGKPDAVQLALPANPAAAMTDPTPALPSQRSSTHSSGAGGGADHEVGDDRRPTDRDNGGRSRARRQPARHASR